MKDECGSATDDEQKYIFSLTVIPLILNSTIYYCLILRKVCGLACTFFLFIHRLNCARNVLPGRKMKTEHFCVRH